MCDPSPLYSLLTIFELAVKEFGFTQTERVNVLLLGFKEVAVVFNPELPLNAMAFPNNPLAPINGDPYSTFKLSVPAVPVLANGAAVSSKFQRIKVLLSVGTIRIA